LVFFHHTGTTQELITAGHTHFCYRIGLVFDSLPSPITRAAWLAIWRSLHTFDCAGKEWSSLDSDARKTLGNLWAWNAQLYPLTDLGHPAALVHGALPALMTSCR